MGKERFERASTRGGGYQYKEVAHASCNRSWHSQTLQGEDLLAAPLALSPRTFRSAAIAARSVSVSIALPGVATTFPYRFVQCT